MKAMKSRHMLICASLLIVTVVLVATGVGSYVFLPLALCMAMMDRVGVDLEHAGTVRDWVQDSGYHCAGQSVALRAAEHQARPAPPVRAPTSPLPSSGYDSDGLPRDPGRPMSAAMDRPRAAQAFTAETLRPTTNLLICVARGQRAATSTEAPA